MKKLLLAVCAATAFGAFAEDYEIYVEPGETVTLSSADDAHVKGLLAEGVKDRRLYKTGLGRLIINYDFKKAGYAGEIRVHEGYLRVQHDGGLGTTAAGTFVDDGATFEGDCSLVGNAKLSFTDENLTFEGFGVDGSGCVKMVAGNSYAFFTRGTKTMLGDSLWNGESGRMDVRFGTFNMNGHTFHTTNTVAYTGCTVSNPGTIRAHSPFTIDTSVDFGGDGNHEFIIEDGCNQLSLQTASIPIKWGFQVNRSLTLMPQPNHKASISNMTSAVTVNVIEGPVQLNNNANLTFSCSYVNPNTYGPITETFDPYHHLVTIKGPITGEGRVSISGSAGQLGFARLLSNANDFSGALTVGENAILEVASVDSLGAGTLSLTETSRLTFLYDSPSTYELDDERYAKILALNKTLCASDKFFSSHPNVVFQGVPDYTMCNNFYSGNLFHLENNVLTFGYALEGKPTVKNTAGTLVIDGEGVFNALGNIIVNDGTVAIANNAEVHLGDSYYSIGGVNPACPRLFVGTNATFCCRGDNPSTSFPFNHIGGGKVTTAKADFVRGILEISPGALVTNQFCLCTDNVDNGKTNAMGAVYMRGGTVVQHSANNRTGNYIGSNGEGYFEMEGGYFDASKESEWFQIGRRTTGFPAGRGVMHVKGGTLEHHSTGFVVNNGGGFAHLRQSGGLVTNDHVVVGSTLWVAGGSDYNEGVVTLEGDAVMNLKQGLFLGAISNSVSVLNLNGGRLEAYDTLAVQDRREVAVSTGFPATFENNLTYINFNGGEFKSLRGNLWNGWWDNRATRVTVYAGGATVDVGEFARNMRTALRAPTGKGVKAISFTCTEPWKYIGAPYVRIIDPTGTGSGATAAADFDSHAGTITGITVTSPGCNYGEGTYAEISFGGSTAIVTVPATLETLANTGDFTKKGKGLLHIGESAIEVGGWIRCLEGSIEFGAGASTALPNAMGIALAEGTSMSLAKEVGLPALAYAGTGKVWISDAFVLANKLVVDAADLAAGRCLKLKRNYGTAAPTIAEGTKLEIVQPELLAGKDNLTVLESDNPIGGYDLEIADQALAGQWHFRKTFANNVYSIKLLKTRPVVLILR